MAVAPATAVAAAVAPAAAARREASGPAGRAADSGSEAAKLEGAEVETGLAAVGATIVRAAEGTVLAASYPERRRATRRRGGAQHVEERSEASV